MTVPTLPLGDVFEVQLGKMLDAKGNRGEPYPYLANRNVQWDRCNLVELPTMPFTEKDRQRFDLRPGDLLVCEGGEVGRTAVWRGEISDCFFQKAVHRLRPRRHADPRFGLYYMRWATRSGVFKQLTTSTSIAHLTKEKLETAPFPDVPVAEQRRIAAILDEADALRGKRREALGMLDDLLRATFLEMFGDPVTNPKQWPVVTVGEVVSAIESGWSPTCEARPAGVDEWGVLKLGAVTTGRFIESHKALPVGVEAPEDLEVRAGDVLFTRKNTHELVGAAAYVHRVRPKLLLPDLVFRLRLNSARVAPAYLATCLMIPGKRDEVQALAAGSSGSMPGISKARLATVSVPLPPMTSQRQFHSWVDGHERHRESVIAASECTETLFSSLLQRAFTGEL